MDWVFRVFFFDFFFVDFFPFVGISVVVFSFICWFVFFFYHFSNPSNPFFSGSDLKSEEISKTDPMRCRRIVEIVLALVNEPSISFCCRVNEPPNQRRAGPQLFDIKPINKKPTDNENNELANRFSQHMNIWGSKQKKTKRKQECTLERRQKKQRKERKKERKEDKNSPVSFLATLVSYFHMFACNSCSLISDLVAWLGDGGRRCGGLLPRPKSYHSRFECGKFQVTQPIQQNKHSIQNKKKQTNKQTNKTNSNCKSRACVFFFNSVFG